jgi:quinol monooxygenase YgiN
MTYALINKLIAKPGQRVRVVEILLESGKLFDDNPACEMSLVAESAGDPDVVWVIDRWSSEEEHEKALRQPELRPFVDKAKPLLVAMPDQTEIRVVGGKGL